MFMIIRKKYLERIIPFINKPLIKAIIGVRRSGKTVLMMQLKDYLISSGIDAEHVLYINFESMAFSNLLDSNKLYSYVLEVSKKIQGKRLYLFFDEIQVISYWETLLASFLVDIDCDIYISGSNSKLLSSELATHIAGRYIHIDIYPFNFLEYKDYSKILKYLFQMKNCLMNILNLEVSLKVLVFQTLFPKRPICVMFITLLW